MISRNTDHNTREVFAIDGKTLIAIHGEFCLGCSAARGTCGEFTDKAIVTGRITDARALESLRIAREFVSENDAYRAGFGS